MNVDLTTLQGFAVASAMRGPDFTMEGDAVHLAYRLKTALTARLRFLATDLTYLHGFDSNEKAVGDVDLEVSKLEIAVHELTAINFAGTRHYLGHMAEGAEALVDLLVDAGGAKHRQVEAKKLAILARRLLSL